MPKKDPVDWRPLGDYSNLNAQIVKEKYPILCNADFTAELHDKQIFSHKILLNPADAYKTALCTPFVLFDSILELEHAVWHLQCVVFFQRINNYIIRDLWLVYEFLDDFLIT